MASSTITPAARAYRLIARAAIRIGFDQIAEWAARNYRRLTNQGAFDDRDPE